jgi:hypothetical protein
MHSSWPLMVLLAMTWSASAVNAQIITVTSETRRVYALAELVCDLRDEAARSSSVPGAPFDASVSGDLTGCNPWSMAYGTGSQTSAFFADSIYVNESVYTWLGNEQSKRSKGTSDASIYFSLPPGRWCSYTIRLEGDAYSERATAIADMSLNLLGPRGGVINSLHCQCGPGTRSVPDLYPSYFGGILEPGDYDLEVHSSAETVWLGDRAGCSLEVSFKVWPIPTPVQPTAWGQVKSLYR